MKTDGDIVINGKTYHFFQRSISFEDIANIVFPGTFGEKNVGLTCTWKTKKAHGSLSNGDRIKIESGLVINITATNRA